MRIGPINKGVYLALIGVPVFSAGADGNAGAAPVVCAAASGRAGSGAGVVGRAPPGFDSAGSSFGAAAGEDCKGCVACAICGWRAAISISEAPDTASPVAINRDARRKSFMEARFLSSEDIVFTASLFTGPTAAGSDCSPENPGRTGCYSGSSPASPSSVANASSVPLLFQASAATGAVSFRRTRISAPSVIRTIRMVPSL
jgi:hypothetical protein